MKAGGRRPIVVVGKAFLAILRKPSFVFKFVLMAIRMGPQAALRRARFIALHRGVLGINEKYRIWLEHNSPSKQDLAGQPRIAASWPWQPTISLIVPVYNPEIDYLTAMINSVLGQTYPKWELCLADDASTIPEVATTIETYVARDPRISFVRRQTNGHICAASNSALELAKGEFIGLLDHDDVLTPQALFECVRRIQDCPDAGLIYTDEDKLDFDGITRIEPFMKPDWSPDLMRGMNYITHFTLIRRSIVTEIGGFRPGTEGAQDWDLILRASEEIERTYAGSHVELQRRAILHVPQTLYSWRKSKTSTASDKHVDQVKPYVYSNQEAVLRDAIARSGLDAEITDSGALGLWRTRYKIVGEPLVSIIIPTKDQFELLSTCLTSITQKSTYSRYEIVLIDTGSTDARVKRLYEDFSHAHGNFRLIHWKEPFNFASVCNFGAEHATGEHLLFLNNDTEVITPGWIEDLLRFSQLDRVGAVGAKLLYPDGTVQHAGVLTGMGGVASHYYLGLPDSEYQSYPMIYAKDAIRNVSAVTGACLMVKKSLFNAAKGFDPKYRIAYNDVDFCLRLIHDFNKWNIYNPEAALTHFESISVGRPEKGNRDVTEFMRENEMMYERWGEVLAKDPFYNPNLTLVKGDFSPILPLGIE